MSETVLNVGFAEFVAKLIGETFDSILTASTDQELRILELSAASQMSAEAFAAAYINEEAVDAALTRLYPSTDGEHDHRVYEGAEIDTTITDPLGVEVAEGAATMDADLVSAIREAVTAQLATNHLSALKTAAARGFTRIVVDTGRICARLVYTVHSEEDDESEVATTDASAETDAYTSTVLVDSYASRISALSQPLVLPGVRLLVRPVDDRSSQVTQITTNIYGEVELTFKTVTG